ncbi:hypothetical protein J3R82DRAFT_11845, partial [Butyriboletus roseoflavus]
RKLLKQITHITAQVPGSNTVCISMRNEMQSLTIDDLPSFYFTINPTDVYNPIVKILARSDINID